MVTGFRRSISLPVPNPNSSPCKTKEKAYHVRSTSLPCRSHPVISQLEDEVRSLRSWQTEATTSTSTTSAWLMAGLTRLDLLHVALDDLLQLQQTQESLHRHRSSSWSETLLDDFLRFADAYGCFRETLVSLQQLQSEAQGAIRRRDETNLRSNARSHKKAEKELLRLASLMREMSNVKAQEPVFSGACEAELAGILREVKMVMAAASSYVFSGLVALSSSSFSGVPTSSSSSSSSWMVLKKRLMSSTKKTEEEWERNLEGLKELERCIEVLEIGSERVYKCLINNRVALLNILAP